jgi:hypothetical protein
MYEFGQDNDSTEAVQKETTPKPRKVKKAYENDFGRLNKEGVMGAALGPKMYSENSTSEVAKKRLRRILAGGGYKFGDLNDKTGLDADAILRGGDVK